MGVKLRQILARARTEGPLTAALLLAGLATVAVGAAMVYRPAGVIFAGIATVACVFLYLAGETR